MWITLWFASVVATASGIALDMRCLKVNRVGLSRTGWALACALGGLPTVAFYLRQRRAVWRSLIDAVWQVAGDSSQPAHLRRQRLLALRNAGVIGQAVYRTCQAQLDAAGRTAPPQR
ncbi:hypothetical protein ACFPTO_24220 [Paraburkholderia denitrificans]|uniref:Uncharacterized protein n=1 Tax=Paraburkholderia denitrificans TaxID=694025 RepID=A0ABW0JFD3_9BURK